MDVLWAWLIGIPAAVVAFALFLGCSRLRAAFGYAVLVAGFVGMAAFDRVSAAVLGGVLALVYATGQGGQGEERPAS